MNTSRLAILLAHNTQDFVSISLLRDHQLQSLPSDRLSTFSCPSQHDAPLYMFATYISCVSTLPCLAAIVKNLVLLHKLLQVSARYPGYNATGSLFYTDSLLPAVWA